MFGPQARSSYLQIQEATAVQILYDLRVVSSNVHFSNSLLYFKLVLLVFKNLMMLQQVIFTSRYRRNTRESFHSQNSRTVQRDGATGSSALL
jgi:hypothetical protein